MEIKVKLMGLLRDKTPAGGRLSLPQGAAIHDALRALQIPADSVQVFTVNGKLVRQREHVLAHGDELSVLPPAVGG